MAPRSPLSNPSGNPRTVLAPPMKICSELNSAWSVN